MEIDKEDSSRNKRDAGVQAIPSYASIVTSTPKYVNKNIKYSKDYRYMVERKEQYQDNEYWRNDAKKMEFDSKRDKEVKDSNNGKDIRIKEMADISKEITDQEENTYTIVTSRKKRRSELNKTVIGIKNSSSKLMGMQYTKRKSSIFIFNVRRHVSMDVVKEFLENEDIAVHNICDCTTIKNKYNCFRIDIYSNDYEKVMKEDFWPNGVGCRRFYQARQKKEQQTSNIKNVSYDRNSMNKSWESTKLNDEDSSRWLISP